MDDKERTELSEMISDLRLADRQVVDGWITSLYEELRSRAKACFRGERRDHTLQPTALVHEVYMRLAGQENLCIHDRAHFLACAARVMRHVLINHAKKRSTLKRGAGAARVPLEGIVVAFESRALDLVALDDALSELADRDAQKSRIVELRFFGGLTVAEVARVLQRSPATVEREWRFARAWLYARLCPGETDA